MMSGRQVSLVYFYLISAGALALIVIGVFNSVNFLLNITQYKDYPLRYQQDCESIYPSVKLMVPGYPIPATQSAFEMEQQKELCQRNLDKLRKQQKLDDLRNSITFTAVGTILFLIHFPIARRQSKI